MHDAPESPIPEPAHATLDAAGEVVPASQRPAPTPKPAFAVCPYCGHESANHERCDRCRGLMDPLSRQASQNAMGPWFIRDDAAPFRPGCSYQTLRALASKGRVTRQSIVRGPTTRQFWTRAASTPGLAHLLGECHACHTAVSADFERCPSCGAVFESASDRQSLGLAPIRLLPGHATTEEIARSMVDAIRQTPIAAATGPRAEPAARMAAPVPAPEIPSSVLRSSRRSSPARVVLMVVLVCLGLAAIASLTVWLAAPDLITKILGSGGT